MEKDKEYTTIRITKKLHKKISILAANTGELITDIIERLLEEALKKEKG